MSEEKGSSILEKTPFFIWYQGCKSMKVDKTCQTVDALPTIANMYGIDLSGKVIGNDVFNPENRGFAFFPNGTWISSDTYVSNGNVISQGDMTNTQIEETNEYLKSFYEADEAILESDYYAFSY